MPKFTAYVAIHRDYEFMLEIEADNADDAWRRAEDEAYDLTVDEAAAHFDDRPEVYDVVEEYE